MIFVYTFLFGIIYHNILRDLIALIFHLAEPTQKTAVLFLTSKTSVNRRSDFLALHFLTIMEGPGDIGLLSVNQSEVDNTDASIIYLN